METQQESTNPTSAAQPSELSAEQQAAIYGGSVEESAPQGDEPGEPRENSDDATTALERLLAEAEARGYERGREAGRQEKADEEEQANKAEAGMWQPVDPSTTEFLSGLRAPVWP